MQGLPGTLAAVAALGQVPTTGDLEAPGEAGLPARFFFRAPGSVPRGPLAAGQPSAQRWLYCSCWGPPRKPLPALPVRVPQTPSPRQPALTTMAPATLR